MTPDAAAARAGTQQSPRRKIELIMGMPVEIDLRDETVAPQALDRAFEWLRRVDTTFSTYMPDSEISHLNAGFSVSPGNRELVCEVLRYCDRLRQETDGYFDIETNQLPVALESAIGTMISHGIDPSGLVKGWAVDRAGTILDGLGAQNYLINAGGDIRLRGAARPDLFWLIGIRHPIERDKLAAVVQTNDAAIATSGSYERGRHIVDPHTGMPPTGVLSVTIMGPDLAYADAYATAAFAMGVEGPRWTMSLRGYEAMTILDTGLVSSTPGFPMVGNVGEE